MKDDTTTKAVASSTMYDAEILFYNHQTFILAVVIERATKNHPYIAFLVRHLRRSRSTRWSINQCHASNYNARCNSMMKKSTFSKTMLYHRRHHHCLASWHLVVIMLINAKFYSMPCHSRNANASTSYVATTQCKNQLTRAVRC
ncbi:hypothetical protein ACHAXH_001665 [Discostella pseudostelligera]